MKILLTGASGFLGSVMLSEWKEKHEITTIGRNTSNDIVADLSQFNSSLPAADFVVHAAGKAHSVPKDHIEAADFFKVNVNGTANLLKALADSGAIPKTFVFISSVAVYGLREGNLITEETELKATDAYGKSKIDAEKLIQKWCEYHRVNYFLLRLPLVSGKNAPGNLEAMMRAIKKGYYFSIGKGKAKRSMVSALDVAQLIPRLNEKSGAYNLTYDYHPELREIENYIAKSYGRKISGIPWVVAKAAALAGDLTGVIPLNSNKLNKLTHSLTFSSEKARTNLNWAPATFDLSVLFE